MEIWRAMTKDRARRPSASGTPHSSQHAAALAAKRSAAREYRYQDPARRSVHACALFDCHLLKYLPDWRQRMHWCGWLSEEALCPVHHITGPWRSRRLRRPRLGTNQPVSFSMKRFAARSAPRISCFEPCMTITQAQTSLRGLPYAHTTTKLVMKL